MEPAKAGADAVVKRIQDKGGKAVAVQGDVSKPDGHQTPLWRDEENLRKLDVLVNNAGIYEFKPLEASSPRT